MNKMSKDKRDKLLLICLGAIGVCALLYFMVITDDKDAITELEQKMVAIRTKKASNESLIKRQGEKEQALELARTNLAQKQIDMFRPGEKDHVRFMQMIIYGMTNQNLNLSIVDIKPPDPLSDPGILPQFPFHAERIHVGMEGPYVDFGRFLATFENQRPYMRIQNLGIQEEVRNVPGARAAGGDMPSVDEDKLRFDFDLIVMVGSQL
jgi:hypothetical protein